MRFTKLIAFLVLLCAPMVFAQVVPAVCGFVASDNFTRANASSLGSNWTGSGYSISSNKAYPSVVFAQVYYSGSTFTANQCSSVQVAAWDTSNYPGVAVRVQASAEKGYYAYCATASGNCSSIKLVKATASGSYTTEETISSLSLAPGGTLTVVATGTSSPVSVSVYWNGSQIGTTFSDSSSPYTSGYPGMMTDYSSSATYGATYWEGDNYQTPACAVPTSNWPAGILLTQQNIALTSPSCTICYTTDGSTPTETGNACSGGTTQTYTAAVASASSGSWTLKALATAPGYTDSTVVTLAYTVAPSDVPIISDNFASYENANLEANQTQQLPLDAIQTVGNWTAWGGISGDLGASAECPADAIAPVRNGYQAPAVSGNATCGTGAVSTARTGYSTSQYSKAYIVGAPGGVMTNATTGGSSYQLKLNTCASSGVNIYLYKYVSGTPTTLLSSIGQSVACGSTIELRSANGGLQPLINGAAPPGFASAIYQDSTLTGGQPGITGKISDWSAGNVGVADGTSVATYTPTYPTYTDTFPSTWALGWPEFQMDIHTGVSGPTWPQWNSPLSAALVSGSTYGLSLTHNGDAQISWRGGSFGSTGQYQIFSPAVDPTNIGFNWYFGELQMNPWVPGTTGGCATAGTTSSCADIVAYYVGVEYVGALRGAIGTPITITSKAE